MTNFHAFVVQFAAVAVLVGVAAVSSMAGNADSLASDTVRAGVGAEWVKNIPVLGIDFN